MTEEQHAPNWDDHWSDNGHKGGNKIHCNAIYMLEWADWTGAWHSTGPIYLAPIRKKANYWISACFVAANL